MTWQTKKLGEVCEINPKFKNNFDANSDVGFLTMADVSENAEIINIQKRKLSEVKKGFTNFINGDILVAKITPCFENGKGAFVEGMLHSIGFGSTEFHVLRTNKDLLLNKYIYYFVNNKSFRAKNASFMTGNAGQRRISTDFLKKVKILLPPLATQKQIVNRLDKIAEAQKLNDGLIKKTEELFQSLLHKELNPAGRNWEVKDLEDIAKIIMGQSPSSTSYNESSDGLPFFQGKADFGELYPNTVKYCSTPSRIAEPEDILISVRAPVGDINLAKCKSCIGRGLAAIRGNTKIVEQMLLYFIFKKNEKNWQRQSTGSTFAAITKDKLTDYKIPLPPLEVQKKIVAKLSAVQDYKRQLLVQKSKLKEIFDSSLTKSMSTK